MINNLILGCIAATVIAAPGQAPRADASTIQQFYVLANFGFMPTEEGKVVKLETTRIPYEVRYVFDRSLGPGRMLKTRNGIDGYVKRLVQYEDKDGKLLNPEVLFEERQEPVSAVINIGRDGWETTRGNYTRKRVLVMEATGYSHEETDMTTAMGLRTGYGIVAVDPRTIKLGTKVFVEGYGFAIVGDTGGAIKGNRIDLCFSSRREALNFGRKKVTVHILE